MHPNNHELITAIWNTCVNAKSMILIIYNNSVISIAQRAVNFSSSCPSSPDHDHHGICCIPGFPDSFCWLLAFLLLGFLVRRDEASRPLKDRCGFSTILTSWKVWKTIKYCIESKYFRSFLKNIPSFLLDNMNIYWKEVKRTYSEMDWEEQVWSFSHPQNDQVEAALATELANWRKRSHFTGWAGWCYHMVPISSNIK